MLASDASEYLVAHGKGGAFGRFASALPLECARGQRVVVKSLRGLELGSVLCRATARHEHMLGKAPVCDLLRVATAADEAAAAQMTLFGHALFEEGRRLVGDLRIALEVVDVEVMLDGKQAIVQHLSLEGINATPLALELGRRHHIEILLENLAGASSTEEETHGCGKPDCGRVNGSSCTDCGSGGGCSSCGAGKVDMRAYFAHLRTNMENKQRTALL